VFAWGETDDRQPSGAVSEGRNRRVPPQRKLRAASLPQANQPRAQWTIARCFRFRNGRQLGGLKEVHAFPYRSGCGCRSPAFSSKRPKTVTALGQA
jgi:2-amino-4-hydroxy-6-hydroxymethyldihydropteridine diphosphokinase